MWITLLKAIAILLLAVVALVMFLSYVVEKESKGGILSYLKNLPKNFLYFAMLASFAAYALAMSLVEHRKKIKKERKELDQSFQINKMWYLWHCL